MVRKALRQGKKVKKGLIDNVARIGQASLYGKKSFGVVRTTYLIDENGIIVKAFSNVKAAENPSQMLEKIG